MFIDKRIVELSGILNEIHYTDAYGDKFVEFRKKYSKILKQDTIMKYKLFVIFLLD